MIPALPASRVVFAAEVLMALRGSVDGCPRPRKSLTSRFTSHVRQERSWRVSSIAIPTWRRRRRSRCSAGGNRWSTASAPRGQEYRRARGETKDRECRRDPQQDLIHPGAPNPQRWGLQSTLRKILSSAAFRRPRLTSRQSVRVSHPRDYGEWRVVVAGTVSHSHEFARPLECCIGP